MARIRRLSIRNFRGIARLDWSPSPGMNCLIGPGDSGKSTVLDALDWCLGARRSLNVSDADFHQMDVENSIDIEVTIGELTDGLKGLEAYGPYLLGLNEEGVLEDEPAEGIETVLNLRLTVSDDLEPQWTLVSPRAQAQGLSRNLTWVDRVSIAPTRIGTYTTQHLGWQKGSILNLVSDVRADASAELAEAARDARASFGDSAGKQLNETLAIVGDTAAELGIPVGDDVRAMLDAHSINFSGGTISLHNSDGVPLRKLGLGSSRLLIAGLQNHVAQRASIALVDEVELGLEPHRISKFLTALGSRSVEEPVQVFMTTHSPVVLRELKGTQLNVIRAGAGHSISAAGDGDDVQGTLRSAPEGFLGSHVLVCEGATEVGLVRGIDLYRAEQGLSTFAAVGGVAIDAGGVSRIYRNALPFARLRYHAACLRDDDRQPKAAEEAAFVALGGTVFKWTKNRAFEDELFDNLSDDAIIQLWNYLIGVHGDAVLTDHLQSALGQAVNIEDFFRNLDELGRTVLAEASKAGNWLKRISIMEEASRAIIGPDLANATVDFRSVIGGIYIWVGVADEWF